MGSQTGRGKHETWCYSGVVERPECCALDDCPKEQCRTASALLPARAPLSARRPKTCACRLLRYSRRLSQLSPPPPHSSTRALSSCDAPTPAVVLPRQPRRRRYDPVSSTEPFFNDITDDMLRYERNSKVPLAVRDAVSIPVPYPVHTRTRYLPSCLRACHIFMAL